MSDLSKLSDAELQALYAQVKPARLDAADRERMDPTVGQPWWENLFAGMGKAGYDMSRGAGNLVTDFIPSAAKLGLATRADTDAARRGDEALMNTGGGVIGDILGNVLPTVLLPGSTIPRAIATGVGMGAVQPVGTNDSRAQNMALGGMFSAAPQVGATAIRAGRGLIEPIVAPGRTAVRVLESFADDPAALRAAATKPIELIPGSKPTMAQAVQQPGISTLERSTFNQPGPLQGGMTQRVADQNAARIAALQSVAKDDPAMTAAVAAREANSAPLYQAAFDQPVKADKDLVQILQRPSMQGAMKRAESLAAEQGQAFSPDSVGGLHYMKMALDDMIQGGAQTGIGANERRALMGTQEKLLAWMDKNAPDYAAARQAYAAGSQPINEMQFGQELLKRATPALSDVAGTAPNRMLPERFAQALRDADSTIKAATGRDLPLNKVLSPGANDKVMGVVADLDRASKASALGKPIGSPTAQYLTTQNLMQQVMGPFGAKVADKMMTTPGVGSVARVLTKYPEQRVQSELADLLLNPDKYAAASAFLTKPPGAFRRGASAALPYLPGGMAGLLSSGMFGYGGQ